MASTNFEFLRPHSATAAGILTLSERYYHSDPRSSVVKLREFAELVTEFIYEKQHLPRPYQANLNDLLTGSLFVRTTPRVIRDHFHLLRKLGNRGAHRELQAPPVTAKDALSGLSHALSLAKWVFIEHMGGDIAACPRTFQEPPPESSGRTKRENEDLKARLAAMEAQLAEALEESRRQAEQAARNEEAVLAQQRLESKSPAELASMQAHGEHVATGILGLNEAETRKRLIDQDLIAAGWNLEDPDEVGHEVPVTGLPQGAGTGGKSGHGKVDYVLWNDDGAPLAVIEAKRTAVDAERGRTQAQLYADALERQSGQRPVIFYTNGPEIFLWDDQAHGSERAGYPPRKIYGYYSKESLQTLLFRRRAREQLATVAPSPTIAERLYQVEAIRRVTERFSGNHRRALIVQATGTGKTRVAVSLCDVLSRAKWAKRILFLCDRRELRKQALKAFKEHLPDAPRTVVTQQTAGDTTHRVFVGTYPGMMSIFKSFDVGFFDLIVADESHRSIYNKYRDLFEYFDCLQVGLTATPVKFVERNTYRLFGCEDQDPTFNYEYDDAVQEGYLVPFEVQRVSTKFLRKGIKYSEMSEEERRRLEEDIDDPHEVEFEAQDIDRQVFNKDTTRHMLENLMDEGIRDASGSLPGKSIVFARSHEHAKHIQQVFDEMYPQLGGSFARVIDSHEPDAETLIEDFKNPKKPLTLAISVDMLDTGIDVPEVVNLVFAKPVKSYVKFWQMIGRGTRPCENLFGPGKDKESFRIFDHWDNFVYFDEQYKERQPSQTRSLGQQLFEARVALLEAAIGNNDSRLAAATAGLLESQLTALKETGAIAVREHYKELEQVSAPGVAQALHANTRLVLLQVAAPLMRLVPLRGEEEAHRFDLLVTRLQTAELNQSPVRQELRARMEEQVSALPKNLNQVKEKEAAIQKVSHPDFWESAKQEDLENLRQELRSVMQLRDQGPRPPSVSPRVLDFRDSQRVSENYEPKLTGLRLAQYRNRVKKALEEHFQDHLVYRKIRSNIRVSEADIEKLVQLVLSVDSAADIRRLLAAEEERFAGELYFALKSVVGLERKAVDKTFEGFVAQFPELSARQLQFLSMIKSHICAHGLIKLEDLYDGQFQQFDAAGLDGVFPEENMVDAICNIIATFDPANVQSERAG